MPPAPFRVQVGDEVLADLRERLGRVRWPDEAPGAGWRYGTGLAYMKELVAYWRERYDWRAHEAALNRFRQFTAPGRRHRPPLHPRGRPRAARRCRCCSPTAGPARSWEFHRIIPLLTDPARFGGDPADAFTVVAPSLPGYGFSFAPGQPRFGIVEIADAFAALMTDVLGYRRFAAQGGDWGGFVTSRLGAAYPERLAGIHLNLLAVRRDVAARQRADRRGARLPRRAPALAARGDRLPVDPGHAGPRRSPTASPTRRSGWRRGSSRSSGRGATAAATSSGASPRTSC